MVLTRKVLPFDARQLALMMTGTRYTVCGAVNFSGTGMTAIDLIFLKSTVIHRKMVDGGGKWGNVE